MRYHFYYINVNLIAIHFSEKTLESNLCNRFLKCGNYRKPQFYGKTLKCGNSYKSQSRKITI
ncbi:hypothetical protein B1J94_07760 [Leptospira kirschneri serovar Grippotyphosa]|nr:hypothetical protein B1J94_07760 [Leptospira kirschneri serovar Grippotyphosa]